MNVKSLLSKIVASTLSASLMISFLPTISALDNEKISQSKNNTTSYLKKTADDAAKKSKSSLPSIKALTITAGVLGAMYTPCLYSKIRHSTPRNISEVVGETDETVNGYFTSIVEPTCEDYIVTQSKVADIIKEMENHHLQNDYDKAIFLHDYIYNHCKYDALLLIDKFTGEKTNFHSADARGADGCLINGKAVCVGIAGAYYLLLNKAGIECKMVFGESLGCGHTWNIVKINGSWYHVDVTWDLSAKALHGKYSWFMLTEKEIAKDHKIQYRR